MDKKLVVRRVLASLGVFLIILIGLLTIASLSGCASKPSAVECTKACQQLCQRLYKQDVYDVEEIDWNRVTCICEHPRVHRDIPDGRK